MNPGSTFAMVLGGRRDSGGDLSAHRGSLQPSESTEFAAGPLQRRRQIREQHLPSARRPRLESALINFNNVTKVYGKDAVALDHVDLAIDPGEFVFLVGASGSGKSTMVRLILKELEPSSGSITVNGQRLSAILHRALPKHRRAIGCVFQDFKLLPNKTAAENVAYAMEVTGQKRRAIKVKVPQILELVGLGEQADKYPDQLSGGEQQRVSIARAFVGQPPILIADEPTGNLDPDTSVGIMQLLHRINRIGTTVLVATHDREMVDVMRKRVVALEDGRVVRDMVRGGYTNEV